jgi:hypothetical protein
MVHRWAAAALIALSLAIVASAASLYQVAAQGSGRVRFPASMALQNRAVARSGAIAVGFGVPKAAAARGGAARSPALASPRGALPPCDSSVELGSACGIT